MRPFIFHIFFICLAAGLPPATQSADIWPPLPKAVLVSASGGIDADGRARAVLQIKLGASWKTFWTGAAPYTIPPRLSWTDSQNFISASLTAPFPQRVDNAGITVLGYKNEAVFPLLLQAENPRQPIIARLTLDYAVCDRVCVPLQETLTLTIPPDEPPNAANAALYARAFAQTPQLSPPPASMRAFWRETSRQIVIEARNVRDAIPSINAAALAAPPNVSRAPNGATRFAFAAANPPEKGKLQLLFQQNDGSVWQTSLIAARIE